MSPETALAMTFGLIVIGGVFLIFAALRNRTKILEMAHRERLAMIERGMVPPTDLGAAYQESPISRRTRSSSRLLSSGIVIVGFGLGIAILIGFASREPEIAVGVGGAVGVLGIALIVTALVVHGGRGAIEPPSSTLDRRLPPPDSPG